MSLLTDAIPHGYYCYTITKDYLSIEPESAAESQLRQIFGHTGRVPRILDIKVCPFWSRDSTKPEQESGCCSFLGITDAENHTLLWDQVKECGVNIHYPPTDAV